MSLELPYPLYWDDSTELPQDMGQCKRNKKSLTVFDSITAHAPISAVKQFSNLKDYNQCTFIYFFMKKTYVVGTHLNCLDKSRQFKRVATTYDYIKKTESNIA